MLKLRFIPIPNTFFTRIIRFLKRTVFFCEVVKCFIYISFCNKMAKVNYFGYILV